LKVVRVAVGEKGIGVHKDSLRFRKRPSGPPRIPGRVLDNLNGLIGNPLVISDVAPARVMSALSAEPEETSVALNPRASDNMATKTPTVPAIPTTATIVEVQRAL